MSVTEERLEQSLKDAKGKQEIIITEEFSEFAIKFGKRFAKTLELENAKWKKQRQLDALKEALSLISPDLKKARAINSTDPAIQSLMVDFGKLDKAVLLLIKKGDITKALAAFNLLRPKLYELLSLQARGVRQTERHERLGEALSPVKRSYLNPGAADQYGKEKLSPGKDFKAFLAALKAAENDKSKANLDTLERTAKKYLDHYNNDHSAKKQKEKANVRKKDICELALKQVHHWRLAERFEEIGDPPWDREKETEAASLYAKMLFEEGGLPAKPEDSGQSGGTWWIENVEWGDSPEDSKNKKNFLYKAQDAENQIDSFPRGGSVPREVLGSVVSQQLSTAMGMDFGVPETYMVAIDNSKLVDGEGETDPDHRGEQRTGSIQAFKPAKGELADLMYKDPTLLAKIPKEEIQKTAILDMCCLNMDRHAGNFMVGEKDDGNGGKVPTLVPIDHGLILPSRENFNDRRVRLGNRLAINKMPAKDEPFTPEVLARLELMDPEEMVNGLKASVEQMKRQHPDAKVEEKITDESLNMVRRSAEFTKFAAKHLTPSQLTNAMMVDAETIFDVPEKDKVKAFNEIIAAAKARDVGRRELAQMTDSDVKKMCTELQELGWGLAFASPGFKIGEFMNWLDRAATDAIKIWKAKLPNPVVQKELEDMLGALSHPRELVASIQGKSLKDAHSRVQAATNKNKGRPTEQDIDVAYQKLGGDAEYFRLGGDGEIGSKQGRLEQLESFLAAQNAFSQLEGQDLNKVREGNVLRRIESAYDNLALIEDSQVKRPLTLAYRQILLLSDASDLDGCEAQLQVLETDIGAALKG